MIIEPAGEWFTLQSGRAVISSTKPLHVCWISGDGEVMGQLHDVTLADVNFPRPAQIKNLSGEPAEVEIVYGN